MSRGGATVLRLKLQCLKREINWSQLGCVLLLGAPWLLLSVLTQEPLWLHSSMVTMGGYIAAERGGLSVTRSLLQLLGMVLSFWLLYVTQPLPAGFVLLCMLFAVGITWLGYRSPALRSVAIFTFIPALYLACELSGTATSLLSLLGYLLLGGAPVLLLLALRASFPLVAPEPVASASAPPCYRSPQIILHLLAAGVSVALAALLVELIHFPHGQWLIWSAASVAVGEWSAYRHKFSQRVTGALLGVPIGIALGMFMPPSPLLFHGLALAILLSLVAFPRYLLAFAVRSGLTALTLTLSSGTMGMATERIVDVLLGGVMALIVMWAINQGCFWYRRIHPKL